MTSATPAEKPGFFQSALTKLVARSTTACAVIGLGHRFCFITLRPSRTVVSKVQKFCRGVENAYAENYNRTPLAA